jgi:hypothetical protein
MPLKSQHCPFRKNLTVAGQTSWHGAGQMSWYGRSPEYGPSALVWPDR